MFDATLQGTVPFMRVHSTTEATGSFWSDGRK